MKRLLLGTVLIAQAVMAQMPTFDVEQPLLHSDGDKWVPDGKYVNFTHADWDLDGDKDMLCGYMFTTAGTAGNIVYYENTGNDDAPVFTYIGKLPITVGGAWCGGGETPQVEDFNNDGIMDILCGEYGKRMFIYYGDGNGSVSGGGPITDADGSEEFGFDRFNGPALIDMNGDGLSDMLVSNCNSGTYVDGGDDPGPLRYYENVGEVGASLFKLIEYVTDTTGTEIRHVYQRVYVADMDNDGLDDIITANTRDKDSETDTVSRVMIYRNCGTDNEARFEPGVAVDLRLADGSTPLWYAIRLGVTDINNDGVQDIIVNSSTHFPGKAGIYYGQLDPVSNGRNVYSVQPSQMLFSLNGTTLELEQASDLSLINASGRVVASEQGVVNNVDLQQFNLAPGVHFLQVQQGEEFQTQKVHLQ